jgi:hypothetical protein
MLYRRTDIGVVPDPGTYLVTCIRTTKYLHGQHMIYVLVTRYVYDCIYQTPRGPFRYFLQYPSISPSPRLKRQYPLA